MIDWVVAILTTPDEGSCTISYGRAPWPELTFQINQYSSPSAI